MNKGLSIVIPNYNGVDLFPHTLPTIYAAAQSLLFPYEIIIVDDCSTDDSLSFLKTHYSNIRIVENKQNSGFAVTANRGVKAAAHNLVLLLNNDVQLTPNYFEPQLRHFEQGDTFGVMGRIVGWNDDRIQDGAKYPYFHGVKIKTSGNYLLEEEAAMQQGLFSIYISGANAFLSKEAFLACGGFNELFSPFYVEDYELSLRAWRLGYKCYYQHNAVCRHKTSVAIKSKSNERFVETVYNRNKMFLHAIHLSTGERYVYYFLLLSELCLRLLTGRWTYLKSLTLFVCAHGEVVRSRNELQRAAGDRPLLSVRGVTGKITEALNGKRIIRFKNGSF
jgi:GT2 family glycosyltransferase